MALREIGRARRQREEYVSIAGKYKRLTIFQKTYEKMKEKAGVVEDVLRLRVFVDDKDRGKFWMKLDAEEGLQIRVVGKDNKIVSVYALLDDLGWKRVDTVRLPVLWDQKNRLFMVDCRESLKEQEKMRKQLQQVGDEPTE
jgi:hypothetical protein